MNRIIIANCSNSYHFVIGEMLNGNKKALVVEGLRGNLNESFSMTTN